MWNTEGRSDTMAHTYNTYHLGHLMGIRHPRTLLSTLWGPSTSFSASGTNSGSLHNWGRAQLLQKSPRRHRRPRKQSRGSVCPHGLQLTLVGSPVLVLPTSLLHPFSTPWTSRPTSHAKARPYRDWLKNSQLHKTKSSFTAPHTNVHTHTHTHKCMYIHAHTCMRTYILIYAHVTVVLHVLQIQNLHNRVTGIYSPTRNN